MEWNEGLRQRVRDRAKALGSDGCTAVAEWNRDCCWHHDIMCRTGMDIDGNAVSRQEADWLFWECNRRHTPFSWLSPRSWVRWVGVRIGARRAGVKGPPAVSSIPVKLRK